MPTATGFPSFAKLPPELRVAVWELTILDHNRDRLVPINQETRRIICISSIADSPHFAVSWECRRVALALYPIHLPIYWKVQDDPSAGSSWVDEGIEDTPERCRGLLHISVEHDTFTIGLDKLGGTFFDGYRWATGPIGGASNFGGRSASLTPLQCQGVKRVTMINILDDYAWIDGCRDTLRCAVRRNLFTNMENIWHNEELFPSVEECIYVPLGWPALAELLHLYAYMLVRPGHRVMASLNRGGHIVKFDKEQIKEARNKSSGCVCVDEEVRKTSITWPMSLVDVKPYV